MSVIALNDVSFHYPECAMLFSHISLQVEQGVCAALCGPSGSGKSTLCYLIGGIIPRSMDGTVTGDICLYDKPVSDIPLHEIVQNVGIVFQNPDAQLFSPTVEDEIAFGPENLCLPRKEIGARIDEALGAVGMEQYRAYNPNDLSGGQKQLIALAAMLALKPKILLFDESLSQLDDEATARIIDVITKLKNLGHTILMVEHDEENLGIADRIYRLADGCLTEVPHGDAEY